jgi:hypothetical protein
MDERGGVSRVIKSGGEADAGETGENARRVSRKRDRVFFGGIAFTRKSRNLIES